MYDNKNALYISTHQYPFYPGGGTDKDKGKYNTPTKNIVKISTKEFENVPIHHTKLQHKKDII